jgi:hypothetical protein
MANVILPILAAVAGFTGTMYATGSLRSGRNPARRSKAAETAASPEMRSFVERRCFKKWCHKYYRERENPKIIYEIYRRIPKEPLSFRSNMNNDENQELCGGWYPRWVMEYPGGYDAAIIDRVRLGLKPLGIVHSRNRGDAKKVFELNAGMCRHSEMVSRHVMIPDDDFVRRKVRWNYTAFWNEDGRLSDIFDFDALVEDYARYAPEEGKLMIAFRDYTLGDFVRRWDVWDGIPASITGLILGYPVANTISLDLEGFV